ncbi:MAG: 50S ribosomal protein L11 methyltransferase [Vicinamibacterales bacterium]
MRTWPALDIAEPDDLVQAALTGFDVAAVHEQTPDNWRVFFHTSEGRTRAADALRLQFQALSIVHVDVPDEDWAGRSQANLPAVRVGDIVVTAPPEAGRAVPLAHDASQGVNPALTIVIQPSMGFGTGHHATTRLCLAHLQRLDLRNRTALDAGTGSGVLAIAASRLGATHVLAIDDDPDAVQSARENVALNPGAEVTLGVVDVRRALLRPFDLVLANLTGGLLTAAAAPLLGLTAPGGHLILSGFLETEAAGVLDGFSCCAIEHRSQEDEWVCVTLLRSR